MESKIEGVMIGIKGSTLELQNNFKSIASRIRIRSIPRYINDTFINSRVDYEESRFDVYFWIFIRCMIPFFEFSFAGFSATEKRRISNRRNTFARERGLRFIRLRMGFEARSVPEGSCSKGSRRVRPKGLLVALRVPRRSFRASSSCGETRSVFATQQYEML